MTCTRCGKRPSTPIGDLCRPCRRDTRGTNRSPKEHMSVSLPREMYLHVCETIPSGQRSEWVAHLIAKELDL